MKFKILEILFDVAKMLGVEKLFLRTATIPIGNFTIGFLCVEQMKYLRTQWSHARTTAYINHFALCLIDMEFPVRA